MNKDLNGKKIAVLGLGISNVAVISYLLKHDLKALGVYDTRANPPYVDDLPSGIDLRLGPLNIEELKTYDMLVVSPGLSISLPEIAAAGNAGVEKL